MRVFKLKGTWVKKKKDQVRHYLWDWIDAGLALQNQRRVRLRLLMVLWLWWLALLAACDGYGQRLWNNGVRSVLTNSCGTVLVEWVMGFLDLVSFMVVGFCVGIVVWWDEKHGNEFFFWGDIFLFFPMVILQQIGVCSNTKYDAGQPEQNWNNNKIKGYNLGVST